MNALFLPSQDAWMVRRLAAVYWRGGSTGTVIAALFLSSCTSSPTMFDDYNSGNYEAAFKKSRSAAEAGNPDAQYLVGYLYNLGRGTKQNCTEAVRWWKQASEAKDARAASVLGRMYLTGGCVVRNEPEALRHLARAGAAGVVESQCLLANQLSVTGDEAGAAKWLLALAERNVVDAQFKLAYRYLTGNGVPQDIVTAYMWFSLAAASGHRNAALTAQRTKQQLSEAEFENAMKMIRQWQPSQGHRTVDRTICG